MKMPPHHPEGRGSEGSRLGLASKRWVAGIDGGVLAAFNSRNILFAFLSLETSVFSSEAGGKAFRYEGLMPVIYKTLHKPCNISPSLGNTDYERQLP
jgi:hypothetical protein